MDLNYNEYNKTEYFELLKKKFEKKSLNEDSEDYVKLIRYSTLTTAHLDWCLREQYLDLLENFRKGKIRPIGFCISFEDTGKLTSDIINILESNLIILSPTEKSLAFSTLLEEVFDTCQGYLQEVEFFNDLNEKF